MERSHTEVRAVSPPPLRIVLVVEATGDALTVSTLIDKVLTEHEPGRVSIEVLSKARTYLGIPGEQSGDEVAHTRWNWLGATRVRRSGFGAKRPPSDPLARNAYEVIQKIVTASAHMTERPNVIVLVKDADTEDDRLERLTEGVAFTKTTLTVCIGVPTRMREAWVLNAFEPITKDEAKDKATLDRQLSFDCSRGAHRLNGKPGELRHSKYVLTSLTNGSPERERDAIERASLKTLRERGDQTGLTKFLDEAARLVALLTPANEEATTQTN